MDELVRRWQEQVAPHHTEAPGLRGVYVCGNRDANTVVAVQIWDQPPDQATHATHHRRRFRDHERDILAGADPVSEEYEIFAQI